MKKYLLVLGTVVIFFSCTKDSEIRSIDDNINHLNSVYVGDWNFKGNEISYTGYYVYDSLLNSTWVSDVNYTTNFNDSMGSVEFGDNINELVFRYCEACKPVVYSLEDSGMVYSEKFGGFIGWTITDSTFYNVVNPGPPGYSTSYSTYNIEGWKLN